MDDFGVVLRRVLSERGVGVRELARLVPCDHALISRLRAGRQSPSAGIAQRIDDVLRAGGELAAAGGAGWQPGAGPGLSGPVLARAVSAAAAGDLAGNAAAPPSGDPAGRTMAVLDEWGGTASGQGGQGVLVLTARQVGAEELGALEATAQVFREWGHRFGGGLRRKAVVGQLSELAELLREPHPRVLRRRLLRVTAQVAIVAGHMTSDSGRDQVAYRYYALALDAAREAADDLTGARAAAATARLLVSDGRCRDAAQLLDQAGRSLRQAGPDAAALLVLGQAWALAQLGRHDSVARALDRAAGLTRDSGDGRLLGPAEVAGMVGACLEALARHNRGKQLQSCAERAAGQIARALTGRDPLYVRSRALDLVGLADVRLCQRDLDQALAAGQEALQHVSTLRSARAAGRIHRLAIRVLEQFPAERQAAVFADRVRAQVPLR